LDSLNQCSPRFFPFFWLSITSSGSPPPDYFFYGFLIYNLVIHPLLSSLALTGDFSAPPRFDCFLLDLHRNRSPLTECLPSTEVHFSMKSFLHFSPPFARLSLLSHPKSAPSLGRPFRLSLLSRPRSFCFALSWKLLGTSSPLSLRLSPPLLGVAPLCDRWLMRPRFSRAIRTSFSPSFLLCGLLSSASFPRHPASPAFDGPCSLFSLFGTHDSPFL